MTERKIKAIEKLTTSIYQYKMSDVEKTYTAYYFQVIGDDIQEGIHIIIRVFADRTYVNVSLGPSPVDIPLEWLAPLAKILEDKDEKNINN